MVSINEIYALYFLFAIIIIFNFIDFGSEFKSIRRVSKNSLLYRISRSEIKTTLSVLLFEASGLYLIIYLINKTPLDIIFAIVTFLFASSVVMISYFSFKMMSETEKFAKLFKKI